MGFYFLPYHLNHYYWEIWKTSVKFLLGSHLGFQVGSQVGFWNEIPFGIPGGIGRIPGGILTLQTFSIYVLFT